MKFYRGSAAAARAYVEQDRSRADDYYLTEGSGVATRYVASPLTGVRLAGSLTGESYEMWVGGFDAETGAAKGRLRSDPKALRFVEVVVNGPKTWSLAAALQPEIGDPSEAERTQALADLAATGILASESGALVMADTREHVAALNGAVRDRLVAAGYVDDAHGVVTAAGERIGVGDRVATRRNDRELGVANRDTWIITAIDPDGTVSVQGDGRTGSRTLPSAYVREQVELAYATTVYGAQGETTHTGHLVLGEHTTAAAAYVGMTRGREDNVAHLVAENLDDARKLFNDTFGRDRADLGPGHAAQRAAEDVERYAPHRPLDAALADLRAAWTQEHDLKGAIGRTEHRGHLLAAYGEPAATRVTEINTEIAQLNAVLAAASSQVRTRLHEPAIRSLPPGRVEQEHADWLQQRRHAQLAARARWDAANTPRPSRGQPDPGYPRTPDRGRGIGR